MKPSDHTTAPTSEPQTSVTVQLRFPLKCAGFSLPDNKLTAITLRRPLLRDRRKMWSKSNSAVDVVTGTDVSVLIELCSSIAGTDGIKVPADVFDMLDTYDYDALGTALGKLQNSDSADSTAKTPSDS